MLIELGSGVVEPPVVVSSAAPPLARRLVGKAEPYLYLVPALAGLILWIYRPLIETIDYSFYNWNLVPTSPKIFLHKPLWSPLPGYTEHQLALEESDRDKVLSIFSGATLRAVASGHLHFYKQGWEGDILTVWAPSAAFVMKLKEFDLGLNQVGVVEWLIDGDTIEASFRSVPTVDESNPFTQPAFAETLAALEASVASS